MAGQVSITMRTPAATVRSNAAGVDDAELEPHRLRVDGDRLVGELAGRVGATEDVDHVDRERDVGQRRVALLAQHGRRRRVDRDDALAAPLQVGSDLVRRAARVTGEADHGPRLAVLEHEADVVLVGPAGPGVRRVMPSNLPGRDQPHAPDGSGRLTRQ